MQSDKNKKIKWCETWSMGTGHEQVNYAISKSNQVLGLMNNTISSWSNKITRIIYSTFLRPELNCAS